MSYPNTKGRVVEQVDGQLHWEPSDLSGNGKVEIIRQPPTAEEFEQWEKDAREQGYAAGYAEGYDKGHGEATSSVKARFADLPELIAALREPLNEINDEVEDELLQMVIAISQQLIRRELKTQPGEIIGTIRECLKLLPSNDVSVVIYVHPEDAALIRELLVDTDGSADWTLAEDPLLSRGGCKLMTKKSQIDATVESQLHRLAANVLAKARIDD